MKNVFAVIGSVVGILALVLILIYGGFFVRKDLAPRQQELDRKLFESSPSYIQGKAQEISKIRLELETNKDSIERAALRRRILEISDTVDTTKLTPEMQTYLRDLRNEK